MTERVSVRFSVRRDGTIGALACVLSRIARVDYRIGVVPGGLRKQKYRYRQLMGIISVSRRVCTHLHGGDQRGLINMEGAPHVPTIPLARLGHRRG